MHPNAAAALRLNGASGRETDPRDSLLLDTPDRAVEAEQIRLLMRYSVDVPANLVNAVLVGVIVRPLYPAWMLWLWLGLVCVVSLSRAILRHRYARATGDGTMSPTWARAFTLNVFAAGCLWGLSASVILITRDRIYYNFIVFVLGGTMAGGVICMAVNLRAMLALILPMILPAFAALAVRGGLVEVEMAVMLALFTGVLVWTGLGINRSITENVRLRFGHERMVANLRSSEAAMAEAQQLAHVGSLELDIASNGFKWSAETYRIFGVDPATFEPSLEVMLERVHPDDRASVSQVFTDFVRTGAADDLDYRMVMNDGAIKYVHATSRANLGASGRPLRLFSTVQDVTERRKGENASALLADIVESSDDAIISESVSGEMLSWNRGAEQLFGYRADEAIGQSVRMIVPEERSAEIEQNLATLAKGERIASFDTERLRKDGTRVPVSIAVSLTRDATRKLVGASFIARDITERQIAADALAYRDRLLHAVTIGTGILVKAETLDRVMSDALRVVGETFLVDRVIVMREDAARLLAGAPSALRSIWERPDIQIALDASAFVFSPTDSAAIAAWHAPLIENRPVVTQLVTSQGPVHDLLDRLQVKSSLMAPIFSGDTLWGSLALDSCRRVRDWTTSEIDTLSTFGEIVGSLIRHDETRRSLASSEARLRTVMATAQDAIISINAVARIVLWNRAAERILGYTAGEAIGKQVHELLTPSLFRAKADKAMDVFLGTGAGAAIGKTNQLTARRKDGSEIIIELSLAAARLDDGWGAIGFLRDITERVHAEALTIRTARFDALTGLANRAVFVEALQHEIARVKRGEKSFAVLHLDLDHFKDVNDALGRPVGDQLLKAVAERLHANIRETDLIARFGADEFAIIVAEIHDPTDAAMMADKLIAAFAKPFSVQGSDIHCAASIGIAIYGPENVDPETLLSHADVALYRAKSEERGGYRFFADMMDAQVKTRVTLGAELRVAVDTGQLFLLYQPQVAVDTGRITGVEALARWRHPKRGVLCPDLFIPIAEQIGIIPKLGRWVLWEACRQGRAWLDEGLAPVRIAVNVSALQFRAPAALEADIVAALAHTGLAARMLELELTESVLMDASREHSDLLQRLRESGITIAIDDFGTGYSSLDYLRRFPTNRIKIAQNFVTNLVSTPGDAAIIRATIGLARELDIDVIAEGVETQAQLDLLKGWGCGEVQGFIYARPLTAEDATIALRIGKIAPPAVSTHPGSPRTSPPRC